MDMRGEDRPKRHRLASRRIRGCCTAYGTAVPPISTRLHNRSYHVSSTSVPYSFDYIPILYRLAVYAVVQKG